MRISRVPIEYRLRDGRLAESILDEAHPYIDIEVSAGSAPWFRTRALVDTGSSFSLINRDLLLGLGAKKVRSVELAGNFSRQYTDFYVVRLRPPGANWYDIEVEAGELEIPFDDAGVMALVGLDFLRFGRAVFEGPVGESYFDALESRIP